MTKFARSSSPLFALATLAGVVACTPSSETRDSLAGVGAPAASSPVTRVDRAALLRRIGAIAREAPMPLRSFASRGRAKTSRSATWMDDAGVSQPPAFCRQPNGAVPERYKSIVATFEGELAANAPGAAMAILEHGKLAFAYGAGTKGENTTAPVCPSTLFRIGSMTKALTAAAYLRTVDDGRARVDEKLAEIAPDVTLPAGPEFAELTMRQLLSQQSGVSEITGTLPVTGPSNEGYISQFLTGPTFGANVYFMYPPGALWFYSNTNYMLTGLAIERTSGLTYRDAVRRDVTVPLQMERTTFLPEEVLADGDYANGQATIDPNPDGTPGDLTPVTSAINAAVEPAGGAFSSVLDFAKFMEFVAQGDESVLSRALWSEMRSPLIHTHQEGTVDAYGFGLYAGSGLGILGPGPYFPEPYIGHGGEQAGWTSDWFIFPRTGFGIVFLLDSDYGFFTNTMTQAIEQLAGVPEEALPTADQSVPADFPLYVGNYLDANNLGRVNVTDVAGTLTVSMPDLDSAGIPYEPTLAPLDRDSFALTLEGAEFLVTFIPGADGQYDWLRADHLSVAERISSADAGAPDAANDP